MNERRKRIITWLWVVLLLLPIFAQTVAEAVSEEPMVESVSSEDGSVDGTLTLRPDLGKESAPVKGEAKPSEAPVSDASQSSNKESVLEESETGEDVTEERQPASEAAPRALQALPRFAEDSSTEVTAVQCFPTQETVDAEGFRARETGLEMGWSIGRDALAGSRFSLRLPEALRLSFLPTTPGASLGTIFHSQGQPLLSLFYLEETNTLEFRVTPEGAALAAASENGLSGHVVLGVPVETASLVSVDGTPVSAGEAPMLYAGVVYQPWPSAPNEPLSFRLTDAKGKERTIPFQLDAPAAEETGFAPVSSRSLQAKGTTEPLTVCERGRLSETLFASELSPERDTLWARFDARRAGTGHLRIYTVEQGIEKTLYPGVLNERVQETEQGFRLGLGPVEAGSGPIYYTWEAESDEASDSLFSYFAQMREEADQVQRLGAQEWQALAVLPPSEGGISLTGLWHSRARVMDEAAAEALFPQSKPSEASEEAPQTLQAMAMPAGLQPWKSGSKADQFPVQLQYEAHQMVTGWDSTAVIPNFDRLRVQWDIAIDLRPIRRADLDFHSVALSLYSSQNQGLQDWTVATATEASALDSAPTTAWTERVGILDLYRQSFPKESLPETLHVRVSARPTQLHPLYSLGLRLTTDTNYVSKKKQEFIDYYESIPDFPPFFIKWIRGLDEASDYDRGFHLIDVRLSAQANLQSPGLRSTVYNDATRSITGEFFNNNRNVRWEAIDLLRLQDDFDAGWHQPIFDNNQALNPLPTVRLYVPKDDGSYRETVLGFADAAQVRAQLGAKTPGTLVVYQYETKTDSPYAENAMGLHLQDKEDEEHGTVGGLARASLQRPSDEPGGDWYYVYYPYGVKNQMRIDKTYEWAFCFNINKSFPSNDHMHDLLLTQTTVTDDGVLMDAASPGLGREPGVLDRMKRVFFYTQEWTNAFRAEHGGKEPHPELLYEVYQELIWHQLRDEREGTYRIGNRFYEGQTLRPDWGYNGLPGTDQALSVEETVQGEWPTAWIIRTTQELARRVEEKTDWTQEKADSVRIRLYTHGKQDRYQTLLAGTVMPPVQFSKTDEIGQPLEGVLFGVYDREGQEVTRFRSQGNRQPLYLAPGRYLLKELEAPDGYEPLPAVPFEVVHEEDAHWESRYIWNFLLSMRIVDAVRDFVRIDERDIPLSKDGTVPLLTAEQLQLRAVNLPDRTTELVFQKVGANQLPLDGATFRLVREDGTRYDRTSTGQGGRFRFAGLREGTYRLYEVQAPLGYEKVAQPYTVVVELEDSMNPDGPLRVRIAGLAAPLGEYRIPNAAKKTDLRFRKCEEGRQLGLEGGAFELVQTRGGTYRRVVSASDGMDPTQPVNNGYLPDRPLNPDPEKRGFFHFDDLIVGSYLLREISAPNGYQQTSDTWRIEITEGSDGTLQKTVFWQKHGVDGSIAEEELSAADGFYRMDNAPEVTRIDFQKFKEDGKTTFSYEALLHGREDQPVKFLLYETNYYGNKLMENGQPVDEREITVNEEGSFSLEHLKSGGYYTLKELNPPKGYRLPEVEWNLKIVPYSTGELKILISHHDGALVGTSDNRFLGVKNFRDETIKGRLQVRKVGWGITNPDTIVGLRRAHIRLYTLDEAGERKFTIDADGRKRYIYQERLSAEGNDPNHPEELDPNLGWALFENLDPGQYELVEHMSPAGYEKSMDSWIVTVDLDGKTTWHKKISPAASGNSNALPSLDEPRPFPSVTAEELLSWGLGGSQRFAPAAAPVAVQLKNPEPYETDAVSIMTNARGLDDANYEVQVRLQGKSQGSSGTVYPTETTRILLTVDRTKDVSQQDLLDRKINEFLRKLKTDAAENHAKVEIALITYGLGSEGAWAGYGTDMDVRNGNAYVRWHSLEKITDLQWLLDRSPLQGKAKLQRNDRSERLKRFGDERFTVLPTVPYGDADRKISVHFSNGKPQEIVYGGTAGGTYISSVNIGLQNLRAKGVEVFVLHTPSTTTDTARYEQDGATRFGDHFLTQTYSAAGFADAAALDAFLDRIVQVLPKKTPTAATPGIREGSYRVDVPQGFRLVPLQTTMQEEMTPGHAGQASLSVDPNGRWMAVNHLTLGRGDALTVALRMQKEEEADLYVPKEQWVDLYTSDLQTQAGGYHQSVPGVQFYQQTTEQSGTILIPNTAETLSRVPLRITKVDEFGRVMNQAQFHMEKDMSKVGEFAGQKFADEPYDAIAAATGKPGDHYFRELTPGEYLLRETIPPEGYLPPTDAQGNPKVWRIRVEQYEDPKDGLTKLKVLLPGGVDSPLLADKYLVEVPDDGRSDPARPDAPYHTINEARITNYPVTAQLTFQKRNTTQGDSLVGAVFVLESLAKGSDGQPLYREEQTSQIGGVRFTNLTAGDYRLIETKPPEGYRLPAEGQRIWPIHVALNEAGKLEATFTPHADGAPWENLVVGSDGTVRLLNEEAETELAFRKVRAEDGRPLFGRAFTLESLGEDGQPDGRYQQRQYRLDSAEFAFTSLKAGRYRLTEEATADGYITPMPWEITIEADATGNLSVHWPTDRPDLRQDAQGVTIQNYKLGEFQFTKRDQKGEVLLGAHFRLTKVKTATGESIVYNEAHEAQPPLEDQGYFREVTGSRTRFHFTGLSEGIYRLEEILRPPGVEVPEGSDPVPSWDLQVVQGANRMEIRYLPKAGETAEEAGFLEKEGGYEIINRRTTTEFSFFKVDASPTRSFLGGAAFRLTAYDQDPRVEGAKPLEGHSWESGGTAQKEFSFTGLKPGYYLLEEVRAPKGYRLPEAGWVVFIDDELRIHLPELEALQAQGKKHLFLEFSGTATDLGYLRVKNYLDLHLRIRKENGDGQLLREGILHLSLRAAAGNPNPPPAPLRDLQLDLRQQEELRPLDIPLDLSMDGDYILEETKAPDGYVRSFDRYLLRIDRSEGTVSLLRVESRAGVAKSYFGQEVSETKPLLLYRTPLPETELPALRIQNQKTTYPQSGGPGTLAWTLAGSLLMGLSLGVRWKARNRRRQRRC